MAHQKTIRHGLEVIAALLIVLVLSAQAASSENDVTYINERIPLDYTIINICTPENIPVQLVGESVIQEKISEDKNGMRSVIGQYSIKATGEDANGIRYIVNGNLNFNDKLSGGGPYIQVFIFRMISQGSIDNFFIKNRIHINQDGTVNSEFESDCRG